MHSTQVHYTIRSIPWIPTHLTYSSKRAHKMLQITGESFRQWWQCSYALFNVGLACGRRSVVSIAWDKRTGARGVLGELCVKGAASAAQELRGLRAVARSGQTSRPYQPQVGQSTRCSRPEMRSAVLYLWFCPTSQDHRGLNNSYINID